MNTKDHLIVAKTAAQLVSDLGISSLPHEYQKPIVEKVTVLLHQRLGLRLAESLSEAELKKFNKLVEKGDQDSLAELNRLFPDLDAVIVEEIEFLKEDIKELLPSHQGKKHK